MFKGHFWSYLLVMILFLAQNFLSALFPGTAPSLPLLGVIFFSLRNGAGPGSLLGLFAGLLMELYGQGGFGFYAASWTVAGALSGFAASQVFQDSLLAEVCLPVLAAYLLNVAELVYRQAGEGSVLIGSSLFLAFQPGMLLGTALVSLLLFSSLKKVPLDGRRR